MPSLLQRPPSAPVLATPDRASVAALLLRPGSAASLASAPQKQREHRREFAFAKLARDTACLQQTAAVLVQRSAGKPSVAGYIEELQLYVVSLEELAVQMGAHSPVLSGVASTLHRGLARLFQRTLQFEEALLAKERASHAATRESLIAATNEAQGWREASARAENKLSVLNATLASRDRMLEHSRAAHAAARKEASRMRGVLESHVRAADIGAEDGWLDPAERDPVLRLRENVARVEACAAAAEEESSEVGASAEQLAQMVRAFASREPPPTLTESSCQTEREERPPAVVAAQEVEEAPRAVHEPRAPKKRISAMNRLLHWNASGALERRLNAHELPAPIVMKMVRDPV